MSSTSFAFANPQPSPDDFNTFDPKDVYADSAVVATPVRSGSHARHLEFNRAWAGRMTKGNNCTLLWSLTIGAGGARD